jgi:hypothetical protein
MRRLAGPATGMIIDWLLQKIVVAGVLRHDPQLLRSSWLILAER